VWCGHLLARRHGQSQFEEDYCDTVQIARDVEKEQYVKGFDAEHVVAFGNGNNDRFMLRAVKNGGGIAVAIDNGEGCALDALLNSHIHIVGAANALDLLLDPTRCKATLRF
jgi:soluble P-type ATPase